MTMGTALDPQGNSLEKGLRVLQAMSGRAGRQDIHLFELLTLCRVPWNASKSLLPKKGQPRHLQNCLQGVPNTQPMSPA